MKTILDKTTRDQLVARINFVGDNCAANRGQMKVYQMLKHCIRWEKMALEKNKYKRSILGRLFGKMDQEQVGVMAYKHTDHHIRQFGRYTPSGKKFGIIQIASDRMDIGNKFQRARPTMRFKSAGSWNSMVTQRVAILNPDQATGDYRNG